MALTKVKIVDYLTENDLYEGELSDIYIEELMFNLKVAKDAKSILSGKFKGGHKEPIFNEETNRFEMVDVKYPSGYVVHTNNGKTLQINPIYSKLYDTATKKVIDLCRVLGLSKKARLEIISLSKEDSDGGGDGF